MTALTLTLPRLGETMEEATVVGWLVAPGDAFRRGQPIVELETDKTVVEYPALGDGTLDEALAGPGDRIPVGAPLARATVVDAGEWADATAAPDAGAAPEPEPAAAAPEAIGWAVPAADAADARRRATPVARRLARQSGLALEDIPGTGRRGRIEARDVRAAGGVAGAGTGDFAFDSFGPETDETILLLHGFAGDRRAWAVVAATLARAGARVVAPDLPAHGATRVEAADVASAVDATAAFAAGLPGRLHLVGHSFGAVVATALAERLGGRVSQLTLVTPAGCGREISDAFVSGMVAARTPGEVAHLLRLLGPKGGAVSDAALAAMAAEAARGRLAALAADFVGPIGQRVDILRPLATLSRRIPVRAIFGTEDRVIPATHAFALPPQVAAHFLPTGHMPQWDAPAELAALLTGDTADD